MRPAIDLVRSELEELAGVLVDRRTPVEPFGSYVLRSGEPAAELGRHVERTVFLETFGDTRELLDREYERYEPASVFFVVIDHRRRVPAGMMRIIVPSPAGFKSLEDLPRVWRAPAEEVLAGVERSWDLGRLWDFATLAVAPEYRGEAALGLITQALVQTLTMVGRRWGARRFVAILDLPVLRMLQWRMGRPFEWFPDLEPRPYLGSPASAAVWGDVASWDVRLERADPILHDVFFAGRGLEAIVSTPDWDDAAAIVDDVAPRRQSGTDDAGAVSRRTVAGS
jgi:hypothetical protein